MNLGRVIRAVLTVLAVVATTFVAWRSGAISAVHGVVQARVDLLHDRAHTMGYGLNWGPPRVDKKTGLPITLNPDDAEYLFFFLLGFKGETLERVYY